MPAPPKTAPEIFEVLERSGVLSSTYLDQIRRQVPKAGQPGYDPADFINALVKQKILTAFQAKRLLAGQAEGFFIGKFRILDLIGAGGMGKVFLAEQITMKRVVALKLLPVRQGTHASTLIRFSREARAVARLRHPNITQAYDFDQDGQIYYIAMEYVPGLDVHDLVSRRGKLPYALAAHLTAQAANGLEHARQHKLVHRDIKPGNLMVEPTGALKILDLGLVVFHTDEDPLTLAERDVVIGTADYIAPEQAINSHDVDIRADIYSLGATLHYMLSAQPLFPNKTITEKLLHHQMKEPIPIRELVPEVPEGLAAVLKKMLAKKPEDRYTTPREVREALQPFAKQSRPYDPSWVRFPPASIESYLQFGGEVPPSSRSSPVTMLPPTPSAAETDPPTKMGMTEEIPSRTGSKRRPREEGSGTIQVPKSKVKGKSGTTRKRKAKKNQQPLWLGIAALCLISGGVAALLALGVGSDPEPGSAEVLPADAGGGAGGGTGKSGKLGNQVVLGPRGEEKLPIGAALRRVAAQGTVFIEAQGDGWRPGPLTLDAESVNGHGKTLTGGGTAEVVIHGNPKGPIFTISNVDGLTISDLTLDGNGRDGPLIEISGSVPGLTLQNLKIRRVKGEAIRFIDAEGTYDRPIRLNGCVIEQPRQSSNTAIAFRSREWEDRTKQVRIEGCTLPVGSAGILFGSPVERVEVRDCQLTGNQNNCAIKFAPELVLSEESLVVPVTDWRVSDWFPPPSVPEFDPRSPLDPVEIPAQPVPADEGMVDLGQLLSAQDDSTVLAYAEFMSDRSGQRSLFVGCDDEITIWVNGIKVFEHLGQQGLEPREFTGVATFQEGINRIWVKLHNQSSGSGFSLHLSGQGYVPLTAPDWQQVIIANTTIQNCSKGIMFTNAPSAQSRIELTSNTFVRVRHYPILLRITGEGRRPGTIVPSGNRDLEVGQTDRANFDDARAFLLIPLNE